MKTWLLLLLVSFLSGSFTTAQTQIAYHKAPSAHTSVARQQGTAMSGPANVVGKPGGWMNVWGDKPLPIANYTAKEAAYQIDLNSRAGDWIKTYSPIPDEALYANNNDELPDNQRDVDNEPITPYTWKWLTLEQQGEDGSTVTAWLRRPHWWIRAHNAGKTGNTVQVELTEQGLSGLFTVKEIRPSLIDTRFGPVEREGNYVYRPLTGKFEHQTSNVSDYTFSNGEVIGATPSHPFYSEKRQAYIPIGDIDLGEPIRTADNALVTLTEKVKRNRGAEKVYNLEVYRDHNFLVGRAGFLVHNTCAIASWADAISAVDGLLNLELKKLRKLYPNAKIGYRGSLATGVKYKGGPFDPADWDVDAFIVDDPLYNKFPNPGTRAFRNAINRDGRIIPIVQKVEMELQKFSGYRIDPRKPFAFKVWSEKEFVDEIIPGGYKFLDL